MLLQKNYDALLTRYGRERCCSFICSTERTRRPDQRVGRVLAGFLVTARASGRERVAPERHFGLEANIGRSTLEVVLSRSGGSQSFSAALRDDPCH